MTVMNTKIETLSDMLPPEDELEADLARLAELQELRAEVERLRAAIDEISASLDEYEAHHRHGYTMKCIRRVIARLAIPAY